MKFKAVVIIGCGLVALLPFQNCAPNNHVTFAEVEELASSSGEPLVLPEQTTAGEVRKQTFTASAKSKVVDMIWVIDNSASMTKGADNVRKNVEAFARTIEAGSDLRIALISKKDEFELDTQVQLPDSLRNFGHQVDFLVHSYNPMLVAAAATCTAADSQRDSFCKTVAANPRYESVVGSLQEFLRPESQKVFIFVTDDDSSYQYGTQVQFDSSNRGGYETERRSLVENQDYISKETFQKRVRAAYGENASFKVFGFLALPGAKTCQFRVSQTYMSLVESTGGQYYDICSSDWSRSFSALSQEVFDYINNEYSLVNVGAVRIVGVTLNGRSLLAGRDYSVVGARVTLEKSLVQDQGNYQVEVSYVDVVTK